MRTMVKKRDLYEYSDTYKKYERETRIKVHYIKFENYKKMNRLNNSPWSQKINSPLNLSLNIEYVNSAQYTIRLSLKKNKMKCVFPLGLGWGSPKP